MIGGSPVAPSGYVYEGYPVQQHHQTYPAPQLPPRQPASLAKANTPATGNGRYRGQIGEEPGAEVKRPAALAPQMPAPDQLGLGAKQRIVDVDWSAVRRRMDALSV